MSEEGRNANKPRRRKRSQKLDAVLKLLAFIYVVISIIFYISVIKMDLLPGLYVTIFTVAEIVFTFAMTVGMLKRRNSLKINIICLVIIMLISGVYLYVTNYALATSSFLDNVFKEFQETEEYYVVVSKDSSYNKIEEFSNKKIYFFNLEGDVKSEIENKSKASFEKSDSLVTIGKELNSKKIEAIAVSSVQYNMLDDEIEKFKDNTKIIYTAKHQIETEQDLSSGNKNTIKSGVFNVYISGIDTSGNINNVSRSDANIVVTVNTKTHEILLTSIPRDYYVTLHTYKAKDKLTHSGIYGINETVKTVEDLLDIDINYYVRVNFTTVIKLVDTLGGVDVYSDYDFTRDQYHFTKGYNHVNGSAALVFSRERYSFAGGDNQRVKNQQHVIEAIMKKVLNSDTILNKYTSILKSLEGCFQTNIKQDEISYLVKGQLNDMSSWKVENNALTGTGASNPTYSMGSQLLYTMVPDATSVKEAKDKINAIMENK